MLVIGREVLKSQVRQIDMVSLVQFGPKQEIFQYNYTKWDAYRNETTENGYLQNFRAFQNLKKKKNVTGYFWDEQENLESLAAWGREYGFQYLWVVSSLCHYSTFFVATSVYQ